MISKTRYCKIKRGDVILWHGRPRYVLSGPADIGATPQSHSSQLSICFPIRRRSWTGRARTTYGWNDAKYALTIPRKKLSPQSICAAEKAQLAASGFDWLKEMEREVREHEELIERTEKFDCFQDWAGKLKSDRSYRAAKVQVKRNAR